MALVGAGLLALLVLATVGLRVYLATPAGEQRALSLALEPANAALKGRIEAKTLELRGLKVILGELKLYDPEGELVAEIERIELVPNLPALARRHIEAHSAELIGARVYLLEDERGLNLSRAVEVRPSSAPGPSRKEESSLRLAVERLTLSGGFAELVIRKAEGPEQIYRMEGVSAKGSARYLAASRFLEANLKLEGKATAPLEAPLLGSASLRGGLGALEGEASVQLGPSRGVARAGRKGPDQAAIYLDELTLTPEVASALAPGYPLRATVSARGSLERSGRLAQLDLTAAAGSAKLEAQGAIDLSSKTTPGLTVRARGVNLEELLEEGLESDLALELRLEGGGTSLEDLEGELRLDVPESAIAGQPVGPVRLLASASEGRIRLSELQAVLPGLTLKGTGHGTPDSIHFSGKAEATDLSALARAVGALGAQGVPKLAGAGSFEITLEGPPRRPGVALAGALKLLRVGEVEIKEGTLAAKLPDVSRPLEAQGRLRAQSVRIGARSFQEVKAQLTTHGRELEAGLSTRGLADLVARLSGTLERGGKSVLLKTLVLEYPEARWAMSAPTKVSWGEQLVIEPLTLTSGDQHLSLHARLRGKRLRASLEASGVDLGRLPRALVRPELGLGGQLSASVEVDGKLPRPDGQARLAIRQGAVKKLEGLAANVESTYRDGRAEGRLTLAGRVGSLDAAFDLPVSALLARRAERMKLALTLDGLQVHELLTALELPAKAGGVVSGTATLGGTAEDPQLTLALRGEELSYARAQGPPLEAHRAQLKVASGANSRLGLHLEGPFLGGAVNLMVDTPLTVAGLVKDPPGIDQLLDTQLGAELEVSKLSLTRASAAGLLPEGMAGELHLRASASGTPRDPQGSLDVTLARFTAQGVPSSEASLSVRAGPASVEASLEASRKGQPLLAARGKLGAPVQAAFYPSRLDEAPLELEARLSPLAFQERLPAAPTEGEGGGLEPEAQESLRGVLAARLEAGGTLGSPSIQLRSSATELKLGDSLLGEARLAYDYTLGKSTVAVDMTSPRGGEMKARGEARLELSLPALRRGIEWKSAPIELGVRADRFELAFLSGLVSPVRALGGRLEADAELSGTWASPDYRGRLEWNEGRLALEGYGEYRGIHLLAEATADRFQLKELVARAGGGKARITADAVRAGGAFRLQGIAEATRFPIIVDDQLFAVASLRSSFQGDASATRVDLRQLDIPEAHVELPQVKRKDLQPLDRPADIVLTREGRPLTAPRKKPAPAADRPRQGGVWPRVVSAVVNAPRNIWVRGSDLQAELAFSEGFRLEVNQGAQLFGEIRVLRGRAEVIGRRFDIQRDSQLRFAGPAATPYLNITATHVNEREGVTVNVAISGRGRDITLKPTSQPPLSESEIYTLLATGRRTLKRGSGATITGAQAASVVGSFAASELRGVIAQKLPLDVLSIEAGEEGLAGTRVEAGTYLSDKVYLGYTGEIGADASKGENSHEVRLEYQISPRWSFEAKYGDAKAGGADLIWSKDY